MENNCSHTLLQGKIWAKIFISKHVTGSEEGFESEINVYFLLPQGCRCAKDTEWQFKFPETGCISQSAWAGCGMILEEVLQFSYLTALVAAKAVCSTKNVKSNTRRDAATWKNALLLCWKPARIKDPNSNSHRHSLASPCCWGGK